MTGENIFIIELFEMMCIFMAVSLMALLATVVLSCMIENVLNNTFFLEIEVGMSLAKKSV